MQVLRVISGDHERTAIDFQKHYRLPMVHLMDTDLSLQRMYNRSGWPFLMVVDPNGVVVHKANNMVDSEARVLELLRTLKASPEAASIRTVDGTDYSAETLRRSGELDSPRVQDRFSSMAGGTDGRVFLVWTSNRNGNSDVYRRTWDGEAWSDDEPLAASQADEYDATVVVSPRNEVWFCWTSDTGAGKYNIFVTSLERLRAGARPVQVTQSDDDAMHGRLAAAPDGVLWITYFKWQKNRAGISRDKEIFVRQLKDGSLWKEIQVSPRDVPSYEDHTDPAVAVVGDKALVCWSWDYHRPKGYPSNAESPTIFASAVGADLRPSRPLLLGGQSIDMVPSLTARDDSAWCVWDSLAYSRGKAAKTLVVRRLDVGECKGEPLAVASDLEHICSPCIAVGPNGRAALVWCQKLRDSAWQLWKSDWVEPGPWSEAKPLVTEGNPRYSSAVFDAKGGLWISCTADTEQGRRIRTLRLE